MMLKSIVTPIQLQISMSMPSPESGGIVGGIAGDISKAITDGIINGFLGVVNIVVDFFFWTAKIGILGYLLIYLVSKDEKMVSKCLQYALLYIILCAIKGSI